jgi:hypothetical protein
MFKSDDCGRVAELNYHEGMETRRNRMVQRQSECYKKWFWRMELLQKNKKPQEVFPPAAEIG